MLSVMAEKVSNHPEEDPAALDVQLQRYYAGKIEADDFVEWIRARQGFSIEQPDRERLSVLDGVTTIAGMILGGAGGAGLTHLAEVITQEPPVTGMEVLTWRLILAVGVSLGITAGAAGGLYLSRRLAGRKMPKF